MSDTSDPREMLAAAPLGSWGVTATELPLAIIPCFGPRYDRNGFHSFSAPIEGE